MFIDENANSIDKSGFNFLLEKSETVYGPY